MISKKYSSFIDYRLLVIGYWLLVKGEITPILL